MKVKVDSIIRKNSGYEVTGKIVSKKLVPHIGKRIKAVELKEE